MKNKFLIALLLVFFLVCAFIACREEFVPQSPKNTQASLAVERSIAKSWYEEHASQRKQIRTRADNHTVTLSTIDMEPVWEESFQRKKGRYKTVEALMLGSKRKSFATETSYKKYEETQNSRYNRSLTRLIVLTNQETNETIGFTMTIMPSVEYMEQTDFKPFYNSYLKRDKNFDGYIIYHDLDGNFVNGWKYVKGKITHLVTQDVTPSFASTRSERAGHQECQEYIYKVLVETCEEYCTVNEYGEDYCETTSCSYEWKERDRWMECVWVEDGDEEGGSTSGGGGYIPPTQPSTSLSKIYDPSSTLSDELKKELEKYFGIITQYPHIKILLRVLEKNGYKIKFKEDPNYTGAFVSHEISFASIMGITEQTVMHELMHAYQDLFYTYAVMCENKFNIELETYLFVDITRAMYWECLLKGDSTTMGSGCSDNLEKNIRNFIESIMRKGYINDEDLNTYSLIGEEWALESGTYNDDFPPEILKEMFNYKPE